MRCTRYFTTSSAVLVPLPFPPPAAIPSSAPAVSTLARNHLPLNNAVPLTLNGTRHTSPVLDETATLSGRLLHALRYSSRSPSSVTLSEIGAYHCAALKFGLSRVGLAANPLLNLYTKLGRVEDAHDLFEEICDRDVVSWTTLMAGYSRKGLHSSGLAVFTEMLSAGEVRPNCFTVASAFRCCANLGFLMTGRELHGWVKKGAVCSDVALENALVDFYAKCGKYIAAKRVFDTISVKNLESWNVMMSAHLEAGDAAGSIELFQGLPSRDVVSWNTIISGLMQIGHDSAALELLPEMVRAGREFNHFTFSMALALAGNISLIKLGKELHGNITRHLFGGYVYIQNSLIDMYCKCGEMDYAKSVFCGMPWFTSSVPDGSVFSSDAAMARTVSWSAIIAGYVQNGNPEEALYLFQRMLRENVQVDQFTLTSIVTACSHTGILDQGRQVHACAEKLGHGFDVVLSSAVIDMYAKCGSLVDALAIFEVARQKNVVLWTAVIDCFAMYGQARNALNSFERMLSENVRPNEITFLGVLSACSHAGLVDEGYRYFRSMQIDHGLIPGPEHFTSMVDLLGRAGLLNDANDFILENNITNLRSAWSALLSSCRNHNNLKMAISVSVHLFKLDPSDATTYILLSNAYSRKRHWSEASKVRNLMQGNNIRNQPGQSWIHLRGRVHTFVAGGKSHPQINQIAAYLEKLIERLVEIGYRKDTESILHDIDQEERETLLSYHSEKLAIAYGLIHTSDGAPIRIMKNLRICADCHSAIKYISMLTSRQIIVRDAYRFHEFKSGVCSCADFW